MVGHAKACAIAGLSHETFRTQRRRAPELFRSEWFTPQPGRGQPAGVDRLGVMFLVIFARLTAFGLPPQSAAFAAWCFTEVGDIEVHGTGQRGAGELYPDGGTFLVVRRSGTAGKEYDASVVHLRPNQTVLDALMQLGFPGVGVAALIDLNAVVEHVDAALAEPRTAAQERADEIAEIETYLAITE